MTDRPILINADSSAAEARVIWHLAGDHEALKLADTIDYHAHTAVWFFGPNKELHDYDKKKLGYEHPIRFVGKTLRHAGHLGAGKRRASLEVNTSARKYKIPIHISEQITERALKIFHEKQPKIRQVFHKGIIDQLQKNRILIAPVPYGINCKFGGRRLFFERWSDDLFRQGFSYIPQRAVSDNTKAAGIRILERIPNTEELAIILEAHDALLFRSWESMIDKHTKIIREEFERPIDFTNCSISRGLLSIPCEVEVGSNYGDLKKFKFKSDELFKPTKKQLEVFNDPIPRKFIVG